MQRSSALPAQRMLLTIQTTWIGPRETSHLEIQTFRKWNSAIRQSTRSRQWHAEPVNRVAIGRINVLCARPACGNSRKRVAAQWKQSA